MYSKARRCGLALALAFGAAQGLQADEGRLEQFEERIAQTQERLGLTDEQIEEITPILESGFEAQAAVLQDMGIDLDDRGQGPRVRLRDLRKLRSEMQAIRENTREQLAEMLTAEQMEEFRQIQEEGRTELNERIRARRQSR